MLCKKLFKNAVLAIVYNEKLNYIKWNWERKCGRITVEKMLAVQRSHKIFNI